MRWNPLCFDVNDFRKAPFFLWKSSKRKITVKLHREASVASSNKLLCNDLHVHRGSPQNLTGEHSENYFNFYSLWTNAGLCVKRCTEKHKNVCCNIKIQTRTLCCVFSAQRGLKGMRFRVELSAPSHKRILFHVLCSAVRCVYCNLNSA